MTRALALLVCLAASSALAMGPFEKNHPLVDQGTAAYDQNRFDEALEKFDAAAQERPSDPRVQYDRGLALHKLGRNEEARAAFERARELDRDGQLSSKIDYNLGNVAVAENDRQEAIRRYRAALRKDPADPLARHNLEVLLKNLPPKESPGSDGGTPDGGKGDAGRPDAGMDGGVTDGGSDAGRPDGGEGDGGRGDAGSADGGGGDAGSDGGADGGQGPGDGGQGDGGRGDGGQGDQEKQGDGGQSDQSQRGDGGVDGGREQQDGGEAEPQPAKLLPDGGADVSKKEAEKLLDSMKSNEKNLQLWRFRQKTQKNDTHGKDW